jgi:Flp pilus assembly protein TadD
VDKMMNTVANKLAVSGLALALTMVACKPAAEAMRPKPASAASSDQSAARSYAKGQEAVQKGSFAEALTFVERAVELSPRDAGYRMMLADLYMKNGRFASAETAFGDVLTLDPNNARASLSLALAQIALGKTGSAIQQLDRLSTTAAPGDIGLAYALAGQPQRAIEMLEPAARDAGATGRIRQNLALAYALAGDWEKARNTAAQDVSPAELGARMEQWAALAQPSAAPTRVASLLGVRAVEDQGQPLRLALAGPQPEPVRFAETQAAPAPAPVAQPEPVKVAIAPAPVPVEIKLPEMPAAPAPAPAPVILAAAPEPAPVQIAEAAAPAPEAVSQSVYAPAVKALVTPQPAVVRTAARPARPVRPTFAPAPRATALRASAKAGYVSSGTGRFAVQLGAFSTAANAERAWATTYRRFGLGSHQPRSTTINVPGKGMLHRLSVTGFDSHLEAARICQSVRARGGSCFVRSLAGDAPVRWASRYSVRRG